MDLAGCVFKPLESILDGLPFSMANDGEGHHSQDFHPYMKYTIGKRMELFQALKKTKTVADVFRVVRQSEQAEFETMLEKMNPKRRTSSTFQDETSLREHVLMEIINKVDFDEVADTLMIRLLGTLGAMKAQFVDIAQKQSSVDDAVGMICLAAPPRLCKIAKCLSEYSETSLEDDISFAKCLFECE